MQEGEILNFVWSLLHTGGLMSDAELLHELTVLRRSGALEWPAMTRDHVALLLGLLRDAGRAEQNPSGAWAAKYIKAQATQGVLFA